TLALARATCADYQGALNLMRRRPGDPEGYPRALTASAQTGEGIDTVWQTVTALADWREAEGWQAKRRAGQAHAWFRAALERGLLDRLATDPAARAELAAAEAAVAAGALPPDAAAEALLARLALTFRAD
ncbi:MAG: methylmalonyl Co-A mutase-associated GTPase MeaB, partial [Pseudomonadota bacterium]